MHRVAEVLMVTEVHHMLDHNTECPNNTPWSSHVVMVRKRQQKRVYKVLVHSYTVKNKVVTILLTTLLLHCDKHVTTL